MTSSQEILDFAHTRVATLTAIVDREKVAATIESHGWILVDAMARGIMFDVIPEGKAFRATSTGFAPVEKVNRFTKKDALTLMKAINANMIHWRDAVQKDLESWQHVINMMEGKVKTHA